MPVSRWLFAGIAVACLALLSAALFMEHVMGMEPCPLCMLQRFAYTITGVVALTAAWINPKSWGVRVGGGAVAVSSLAGLGVAWRQIWLQSLPSEEVPPCGPGYEYMREAFPLTEVILMALEGSGDCAEVHWQFMGLSIAGWAWVFFAVIAVLGLWMLWKGGKAGRIR